MDKRFLYRGHNDWQGSIDEDGRLYDENHRCIGRIEGNDVYDNCNIKQGSLSDDGKLWDVSHNLVGYNKGDVFMEPSFQGSGFARGDTADGDHGWEYGALELLKDRDQRYSEEDEDDDDGDPWDGICDEAAIEDKDYEGDAERCDYGLPHGKPSHDCDSYGQTRSSASEPRIAHSIKARRQGFDQSHVPPDSYFSTGRKNEYRINGMIYVDVSGMNLFWSFVHSMLAGLNGKGLITGWDRMTGAWDQIKLEAYRNNRN